MKKRYVLVEGHGEVEAIGNLLTRLAQRAGDHTPWARPLRWPNLHQWESAKRGGVRAGVDFMRDKSDVASLLLIRDEDDGCPRELGPAIAAKLRELEAPFPTAYVLLKPEYEVLFLPCLGELAGRDLDGRQGLLPDAAWDGDTWESRRGLKEWLTAHYPAGRSYKPRVDQLPLTRLLNLDRLSQSGVPCFGTLERALSFLVLKTSEGGVYP